MKDTDTDILEEINSKMAIGSAAFLKKQFFVLKTAFYSLNFLMTFARARRKLSRAKLSQNNQQVEISFISVYSSSVLRPRFYRIKMLLLILIKC